MTIQITDIAKPLPNTELLEERERQWRLILPNDYKEFIKKYNGGIPVCNNFKCDNQCYVITRFLCIIKNIYNNQNGQYDISVVESQIGERLTDNEDLIGIEVLPIAELFTGDYVCLDYRQNKIVPCVCIWKHEESEEFKPVTHKTADTFSEFMKMLM